MAGIMALPQVDMGHRMEVRASDTDMHMRWRTLPLPALKIASFRDSPLVAVKCCDLSSCPSHVLKDAIVKLGCVQQAWAGMAAHMGPGPGAMVVAACMAGQWEEA